MLKNKIGYHWSKLAPFGSDVKIKFKDGTLFKVRARTMDRSVVKEVFLKELNDNSNESLEQFVTNKIDLDKLIVKDGYIIQKSDPIYLDPYDKSFLDAHFYAPQKKIFGNYISTFFANLMVIWLMVIVLAVTLYFDLFKKILDSLENLFSNVKIKK